MLAARSTRLHACLKRVVTGLGVFAEPQAAGAEARAADAREAREARDRRVDAAERRIARASGAGGSRVADEGRPGVQTPPSQVSVPLQRSASGQGVPSGAAACWQPATGSQVSVVHGSPSSHASMKRQPRVGLQVSVVQGLLSLQTRGVPAVQAPV